MKEMSKSPSQKQRLTLEEYLQAHKFRRKIEERNRSKSRGKKQLQSTFLIQHQKSMQTVFQLMNGFLNEAKIDLSELFEQNLAKDKIFIQISALLDKFVLKLKEEIKKMYKDVYTLYKVENQEKGLSQTQQTMTYFKDKMTEAEQQIKKSKLGEVVKDKFKTDDKNKHFLDVIVNKMANTQDNNALNVAGQGQNSAPSFMEALLGMSTQSVEIKESSEPPSSDHKDKSIGKQKKRSDPPLEHTVKTQSPRGRQSQRKHTSRTPHSKEKK